MPQEFSEVINQLRDGEARLDLNQALADAVESIRRNGKATSVTVTLTLSSMGDDRLEITDKISLKKPDRVLPKTVVFLMETGQLTRRNPRQIEMELGRER